MGTGGLTPPGRHRRRATMNRASTSGIPNNSYGGGGISGGNGGGYGGGVGGGPNYGVGAGNVNTTRSMSGAMSNKDGLPTGSANLSNAALGGGLGASAPLMSTGVGDTSAGSHQTGPVSGEPDDGDGYAYKAKALYACE